MPYISRDDDRREKLRNGELALNAGELNYQIFYYIKHNKELTEGICADRIKKFVDQFLGEKPNYQRYNDMTGALLRCYREIERRLKIKVDVILDVLNSYDNEIAQYEDKKIIDNGDVE